MDSSLEFSFYKVSYFYSCINSERVGIYSLLEALNYSSFCLMFTTCTEVFYVGDKDININEL